MKKKLLSVFMLVCMSCSSLSVFAQTDKTELIQAVNVLKGMDDSKSKEWAVETLEGSLSIEKDAFVYNVLSIAYLHGIGVEADTVKAVGYMEQAGANGYKKAYHNLGMYYKYLPKDKQDFTKSYEAFINGVEKGAFTCCYNAGYMLYKGLGCKQDYAKAVELFTKAASKNHVGALFMLGLCHLNGYGVEQDIERGRFFLNQAASLNYQDAMEELLHDTPENDPSRRCANVSAAIEIPETMPSIEPFAPVFKNDIAGEYKGALITYDWSGENIISEKSLSVVMYEKDGKVFGKWIQDSDTVSFKACLTDEGELKFDGTEVFVFNRYAQNSKERYMFDNADICCDEGHITGSLRLYSLEQNEPERPMYIALAKEKGVADANEDNSDYHISAIPNSSTKQVEVRLELDEDASDVKICIYDQLGLNKQNFGLGTLEKGEHKFTLNTNLSDGLYLIRAVAGAHTYSTIIKFGK